MRRDSLITLDRACVSLGGRPVLRDIDWALMPGESWAVLGANGAGKSTFLRLVRGEIWPGNRNGSRLYFPQGEAQASPLAFKQESAMVSPEAKDLYVKRAWNLSALETVVNGLDDTAYDFGRAAGRDRSRAQELLRALGAGNLAERPFLELSQGQSNLVLLARAFMARPTVLFLDEWATGLDRERKDAARRLIEQAVARGMQVVMALHRPDEMISGVEHFLELDQGRVLRQGRGLPDWFGAAAASAARAPRARPGLDAARLEMDFLLRIRQADVAIEGQTVLRDIEWEVKPGQHWAVLGPNGSGKTTLLRLLKGDLHPVLGGSIERFGTGKRASLWRIREKVAWVSPDLQAAYENHWSVAQAVGSGFFGGIGLWRRKLSPGQAQAVDEWLGLCGLMHLASRPVGSLSYGQLRRVLIARAMVREPWLLLLDEPMSGLDASGKARVTDLLQRAADRGCTLVMVSHNPDDIPAWVRMRLYMKEGRICQGNPRETAQGGVAGGRAA